MEMALFCTTPHGVHCIFSMYTLLWPLLIIKLLVEENLECLGDLYTSCTSLSSAGLKGQTDRCKFDKITSPKALKLAGRISVTFSPKLS